MALRVVVFLIALLILTSSAASQPAARCVLMEDAEGWGTGIILHTNLVVSDHHVVAASGAPKVNGREGKIVLKDADDDLAFVVVPTPEVPNISWGTAGVGDEVYYIGNPGPHKCIKVRLLVVDSVADKLILDGTVAPGSSGSGVYNSRGQLVGIIQQLEVLDGIQSFGIALKSEVIRKMMP